MFVLTEKGKAFAADPVCFELILYSNSVIFAPETRLQTHEHNVYDKNTLSYNLCLLHVPFRDDVLCSHPIESLLTLFIFFKLNT